MKERKNKSRVPILAAGGIVLSSDRKLQFAVVQLRKLGAWGLPKGKLVAGEDAVTAARREVLEETGHHVTIHEFLGTLAYEASGRPKVVQFWRMDAVGEPIADLTRDVKAVHWLSLEDALDQLTHLRERAFLEQVGPIALKFAAQSARHAAFEEEFTDKNSLGRAQSAARIQAIGKGPDGDAPFPNRSTRHAVDGGEGAEPGEQAPIEPDLGGRANLVPTADDVPAADDLAPARLPERSGHGCETETGADRGLVKKTRAWFRHPTMSHRQPLD
jgi:8-oxo-dGTP diphosphatase